MDSLDQQTVVELVAVTQGGDGQVLFVQKDKDPPAFEGRQVRGVLELQLGVRRRVGVGCWQVSSSHRLAPVCCVLLAFCLNGAGAGEVSCTGAEVFFRGQAGSGRCGQAKVRRTAATAAL